MENEKFNPQKTPVNFRNDPQKGFYTGFFLCKIDF